MFYGSVNHPDLPVLPSLLLTPDDPAPVTVLEGAHPRLLFVADHAGRALPRSLGDLGVAAAEMDRHIAYDIGAAAITRHLAARLGAPAILGTYSRLVIDTNRYPFDPAAMPEISDGAAIAANRGLSPGDKHRRVAEIFTPYHSAIAAALDLRGEDTLFVSIHTMTDHPATGTPRPEEIALSWAEADGTAEAALAALRSDASLTVGDNTPYAIDYGEDFTTPEHAVRRGLRHLQVEFRQDLVADEAGAAAWADRFLPAIEAALALGAKD